MKRDSGRGRKKKVKTNRGCWNVAKIFGGSFLMRTMASEADTGDNTVIHQRMSPSRADDRPEKFVSPLKQENNKDIWKSSRNGNYQGFISSFSSMYVREGKWGGGTGTFSKWASVPFCTLVAKTVRIMQRTDCHCGR